MNKKCFLCGRRFKCNSNLKERVKEEIDSCPGRYFRIIADKFYRNQKSI